MKLKPEQDAFGHAVWDHAHGTNAFEIIERSDGHFGFSSGPRRISPSPLFGRRTSRLRCSGMHGRVLDIGCNAGRHALYLQHQGLDVLGVDVSPLAIAVAKERGLANATVLSIDELSAELGVFDTILMLGNNFGLFGSAAKARRLLRRFRRFTTPRGDADCRVAERLRDEDPDHLAYLAAQPRAWTHGGQIRLRAPLQAVHDAVVRLLDGVAGGDGNARCGTGWRVTNQYPPAGGRSIPTSSSEATRSLAGLRRR